MRNKVFVAVIMALFFILSITVPVLAGALMHTAKYDLEGVISFRKQAGHYCNTGAEIKQVISGNGVMDKTQTVTMVKGKITMDDKNDWVAGSTPLTVTTVWKLCTPPKYTYRTSVLVDGKVVGPYDVPIHISNIYGQWDTPGYYYQPNNILGMSHQVSGFTHEMLAERYGWDPVSEQFWAVQVQANPATSANLQQNGTAAYGPYQASGDLLDDHRKGGTLGRYYVGDFFNISQQARVSQGVIKRYIDISTPKEHSYLHEDMSVIGTAFIRESFRFSNYGAGKDVKSKWYELF